MPKYNTQAVERRWQEEWEKKKAFRAPEIPDSQKKRYVLDMFPYPSSAGLHVGHPEGMTATDILSRYLRLRGFNVLHPMGWDAFGLPAENFAIKSGKHPQETTAASIENFKRQIQSLGFSYDWSREVNTSDPAYYKWTQWLFEVLYRRGLAYKKMAPVNWCPKDQTVLANEQVVDGACERCGTTVVQKELAQWFFRVTAYADELLASLDTLDWPDPIKHMQRNWIGRSEGAEIDFALAGGEPIKKVLLATNSPSKVERVRRLLREVGLNVEVVTPKEAALEPIDVEEEGDVYENSLSKAKVYAGKTDLPSIGMDTGLFLDGANIDPAKVRRNALEGLEEKSLSQDEIAEHILKYYRNIAAKHGGAVKGYFFDIITLVFPDGTTRVAESRRDLVLTDILKGKVDPYFPLRNIFYSAATEKYPAEHTPEEDLLDLQPYTRALVHVLQPSIHVFTTRPDTLFGVTYVVLAPEHALVAQVTTPEQKNVVEAYVEQTRTLKEIDRTSTEREKTGVFTGSYVMNPANGERVPIWIADYVLASYGTGAVMAVPAHDERDFAFAQKHSLSIQEVVAPLFQTLEGQDAIRNDVETVRRRTIFGIVKHWSEDKYIGLEWKKFGWKSFIIGGVENGEDPVVAAQREIQEETGYKNLRFVREIPREVHSHHFAGHKGVNRYAEGKAYYFELENDERGEMAKEEQALHTIQWVSRQDMKNFLNLKNLSYLWDQFLQPSAYVGEGVSIHSGNFSGASTTEVRRHIVVSLEKQGKAKTTVQYKLRDWLISRQRYWGAPIPVVTCDDHGEQLVPEKDLPVELPDDVDFRPTGESPLMRSEKFMKGAKCPVCKKPSRRETDTMDTFVDSSWYYLRYCDPKNSKQAFDHKKVAAWLPTDVYVGGAEHAVLHLLYSRFIYKALADAQELPASVGREPFTKLRNQGLILGEDGEKMSKSRGNVVNPDDVVKEFGADAFRLFEMFLGPLEMAKPWSTKGIVGMTRFLEKINDLVFSPNERMASELTGSAGEIHDIIRLQNKTIQLVTNDIENFRFNTAISSLMEFTNFLRRSASFRTEQHYEEAQKTLLILLFPFAPHLASELLNHLKVDLQKLTWPEFDPAMIIEATVVITVQVNGKRRATLSMPAGTSQEKATQAALADNNTRKFVTGEPKKVIYVQDKIINFVV